MLLKVRFVKFYIEYKKAVSSHRKYIIYNGVIEIKMCFKSWLRMQQRYTNKSQSEAIAPCFK